MRDEALSPDEVAELESDQTTTVGGNGSGQPSPVARPIVPVPRAVSPQAVPAEARLSHPSLYFNQELSWIDFNWRVLHLALDERTPLLERVRFVAITASNLDEFIQKRVGGLKRQEAAGVRKLSPDGRTPGEQLSLIAEAAQLMHQTMTATWEQTLKPALREQADIIIDNYDDLNKRERGILGDYFQRQIYPILTPLAVDPGHPFPFISNLSLSLAIIMRHPYRHTLHFARLKVPTILSRWLPLHELLPTVGGDGSQRLMPVEQLIAHHISDLFQGMEIVSVHPFRVTRNADLRRDEEEAEDLLAMISEELRERRFASVVRLEVAGDMPRYDRRLLVRELGLGADDVYEVNGMLDLTACYYIANLSIPQLKYRSWEPIVPSRLLHEGETKDTLDIFGVMRQGDLLVHHPYESFAASVQRLIEEAAADRNVLAIKQTLYRTSDESPIVNALIQAAESGKQVAVLVEVKARFDEANNMEWGQMLENAGVHVAYGLVGLKTHTKATLIVRQEEEGVRTYCHIGTGNYHPKTARLYTDLGLLTCDPDLGYDLVQLFHYLTGYAPDQPYYRVLVAPRDMRKAFNQLIRREIDHQQAGGKGHIIAKMNAIDDVGIIKHLYRASQAGVKVELIVRGHSRLRPGLSGYSENISVISILGRFLEHDRIFYFANAGDPELFIGSADWRNRNLKDRVELITPIDEPELKERLIAILGAALHDNRLAWDLDAEGQYTLRCPGPDEEELDFHKHLMKEARKRTKQDRLFF
ncbi:MAG: polyphosphate kinase 1 [Candidatus Promineifilaceae bacterium]|nr:polyphosphate kinase 1 [Candidatus Promineifilaceae bacterium]